MSQTVVIENRDQKVCSLVMLVKLSGGQKLSELKNFFPELLR